MRWIALALAATLALSACGKKGDPVRPAPQEETKKKP